MNTAARAENAPRPKNLATVWTDEMIATLHKVVPTHGIGYTALLINVSEVTVRKKVVDLCIPIGRKRVRLMADNTALLREMWAKNVPQGLIAERLAVSRNTLTDWINKLELPDRPSQGGRPRKEPALSRVPMELRHAEKPIITKPCYYAPTCKAVISTVRGGPRMCPDCVKRIASF